ncbi:S41 family peptidase [Brevundimonas sp.]|uniref:S41 family peptidase n=1 Tax=Brevundimonas sp. TaxID=1871086 RepID=UPI0035671A05
MRSKLLSAAAMALALMGGQGVAYAQARPPVAATAQPELSATQRAAVLTAIRQAVQSSYVFPDRAPAILARLDTAQAAGRYDVSSPNELAGLLSGDLRESSQDGHVYLEYAPDRFAAASAGSAAPQALSRIDAAAARRDNHGLTAIEILPGNVRYLKIGAFHWVSDETGQAYDDAMRFLKGGDAVIIDLRGNGGGSPEAVQYLVSHFLKAGTLEITFLKAGQEPVQTRALDYLPAGRLTNTPLYVLIDQASASAAESFAYDVQQFKLGRLIGAGTAGAANNNDFFPIAPGFMLSLSVGRPVHSVSGGNWEGVGVAPDIATPSAQALDAAHAEALRALLSKATSNAAKADYAWALTAVEARLNPPAIDADILQSAPGAYRNYVVTMEDGALVVARPGHPLWPAPRKLQPLTADGLFAVEGLDILRIGFTDGAMQLWWKDEIAPRVIPKT